MAFASSVEAEAAFYAAFSAADVDAMMRVWAARLDVVCVHPSGPRLEGLPDIRRSWELIFHDRMPRRFELRGRRILGDGDVRIHLVEENISVPGTSYVAPPVLATNVYQRLNGGWLMVLHHGSVAPAALADPDEDDTETTLLH
jgi:ketosteroid isomerase-like protein